MVGGGWKSLPRLLGGAIYTHFQNVSFPLCGNHDPPACLAQLFWSRYNPNTDVKLPRSNCAAWSAWFDPDKLNADGAVDDGLASRTKEGSAYSHLICSNSNREDHHNGLSQRTSFPPMWIECLRRHARRLSSRALHHCLVAMGVLWLTTAQE